MNRILFNTKTSLLLFISCCMGWSCSSCSSCSTGKQSSVEDSVSNSSQRVFYVADRRGDTFLISSSGATIVDNKVMWYEAAMESRAYSIEEYSADSMSISFKFTNILWCYDIEEVCLWAEDKLEKKYVISEITPSERHTISRYNRYLWHWSKAPETGEVGHFLIDSVDLVSSGYTTYTDFFDITKDYRQVDDMNLTFYTVDNQTVDTTQRVQIDRKKVVWTLSWWKAEPDTTRIDLNKVLVRNTNDVVRLFAEGNKDEVFFVCRSNDNPLLWEDRVNLGVYYIDSTELAKSGFKIVSQ